MTAFAVYGLCGLVTASLVVLLAMSTDFFVAYINEIITPCQHDSEYRNGGCICDNTGGVFSGKYCQDCQCKHLGICSIMENSSSRWGCRCPSHQKWTSTLCDKCYATQHDAENCRGNCVEVDGVYKHYGTKCNTVCMPHASSTSRRCTEVRAGGGTCNACNGHGSCTSSGKCECEDGYFTTRGGEQCTLTCSDAGITCPEDQGRCQSIGGQLQCVCEPGWYGRDCGESCLEPDGNGLPCSGHGTCGYNEKEELKCSCSTHWIGDFCEQRCPGDSSYPTSCSGHGTCHSYNDSAVCHCNGDWEGRDCSCSAAYTCFGHGTCNDDASCECFDYTKGSIDVHFDGAYCETCKENWFGSACHLNCDWASSYYPNQDTNGQRIGCNGHGACQLDKDSQKESVTCVCDNTNPDTFCATCKPDYYPKWSIANVSVPHCSVPCEPGTCSNRGVCNPNYDGYNDLCICDKYQMPGTDVELDTLDPKQNCATCKQHWYPTIMESPDRCTKYCAADGLLEDKHIVFDVSATERNYDLMGDLEAQKICTSSDSFFGPDADCNVCSNQGSCYADGSCKCVDGTTGKYCNIQCTSPDGLKCSDHGRCVRNDLELWFNPNTQNFRCECLPYDPYTSETRQRLIKQNFRVAPPPAPHYYGQFCEFHCPRYNEEICADRGQCGTGIAVDEYGYMRQCTKDVDCATIDGSFCARKSSPWDSLMQNGKSFFSSGPDSPGYFTCAASKQCLDDIYSIKWDEFCVNMLHGWYPPVLNTAKCTYAQDDTCRTSVEHFFMNEFKDGSTWCEAALAELMPSVQGSCGKDSHADENEFLNERVPVCLEYTLETTCNAQSNCIYDQTLAHIQTVDNDCVTMQPPCSGPCQSSGNQTCETKTYCRAKTCPDVIFENSIESLCVVEEPCESDRNWADFCASADGNIRKLTHMSTMDTFYTCHMFRNRRHPYLVEKSIPGDVQLNGVLRIYGEDVSVESLRTSAVESVIPAGSTCVQEDFSSSEFCTAHLKNTAPSWYTPIQPRSNWFLPWLVVCPEGTDSLWPSEAQASTRIRTVSSDCKAFHKSPGRFGNDWSESTDEKDTISYLNDKKWSLNCPGLPEIPIDSPTFVANGLLDNAMSCLTNMGWSSCNQPLPVIASSHWPLNPSGCQLKASPLIQRWGESGWSPATVQSEFTKRCLEGLNAPWMPKSAPLPTLCDLGACHAEDECLMCSDPSATCDATSSVQCKSSATTNFRNTNRCGHDGNAWQPFAIPSRIYFCDWVPGEHVTVAAAQHLFDGSLSSRGVLTVYSAADIITDNMAITVENVTKTIVSTRRLGANVSMIWSNGMDRAQMPSETFVQSLENCNDNFNWYLYCADKQIGTTLDTAAPFGLSDDWSGDARLEKASELVFGRVVYQTPGVVHDISVMTSDRVRLQCGSQVDEGVDNVRLLGNFSECVITSVYGTARAVSILVDGREQILGFEESLLIHPTRTFFTIDADKNNSGLSDWTFEDLGIIRKHAFDHDNTGVRFDLNDQHGAIRLSGWLRVQDDDGALASMRLTNGHGVEILHVYVWAKAMYVKTGVLTEHHGERVDTIPINEWFFWSVEAEHVWEQRYQAENHTIFDHNETYFVQEWKLKVRLDTPLPVEWSGTKQVESAARLRSHHKKVADSFRAFEASHGECSHACLHHPECEQWSHSGSFCYLHAKACHRDANCVHGKHTLMSVESHLASRFEIFANEPKTSLVGGTRWRHIRSEPLIMSPVCDPIPVEQIHERWRNSFVNLVIPFEPDATSVCNAMVDSWSLMPDYTSKACYGEDCAYNPNDLMACGEHVRTLVPDVPDNCDSEKYLETNWTAYCHYVTSFDPIQTDNSHRIPFLGGLSVNLTDICEIPWHEYDDAVSTCGSIESKWFKQCFERTSDYENYCSDECLNDIEEMLASTNISKGICQIRDEFLNVTVAPAACECPLGDLVITDFCLMQDAYHEGKTVLVPELYHSECSTMPDCSFTLKHSMNRSDWLQWCSDLSKGAVPGVCSETNCDCDVESVPGVAGKQCELSCPTGISDGKEVACSGPNGRCFAVDPTELIDDSTNQRAKGETRIGANVSGPLAPTWLRGPSPSMDGRCQCALGSGAACSIPCDGCNNGTYGYNMASQYGICDSFNGICRSLPPFMRYNTKFDQLSVKISYNTTAFEPSLGVYRWQYPDRFLFESDETLFEQALRYQYDPLGSVHPFSVPVDKYVLEIQENIDTMLRVFADLCWSDYSDSFEYLDNMQKVKNIGIELTDQQPKILKQTEPSAWGQCTKIEMSDEFHFCFARGEMNAYDNGPLIVRSSGAETVPKQKVSFVKRNADTIYAYGGEYVYDKTTKVFDDMYKITFERRPWSPYDIVFLKWEIVETSGSLKPNPAAWAPMYSIYDSLYLVESTGHKHTLLQMHYATLTRNAYWSKLITWENSASVVQIGGNRSTNALYIFFNDSSVYTFANNSVYETQHQISVPLPVSTLSSGFAPAAGTKVPCTIQMSNESIYVSGQRIATYSQTAVSAQIFIEEWLTIDVFSRANVVHRVHNAIHWHHQLDQQNILSVTSSNQQSLALDTISRTYMHQARWSLYRDMYVREKLSRQMPVPTVWHTNATSGVSQEFETFFSSLEPSVFEETPLTEPNELSVQWEGETFKRSIVILGLYDPTLQDYKQTIDLGRDEVYVTTEWNITSLRLRLHRANGPGNIEWHVSNNVRTFVLVIHLEEWLYNSAEPFVPEYSVSGLENADALFQLFVSTDKMSSYNMQYQSMSFLKYTPGHCSLTADEQCPGLLPYVDLPCSGRGKCSISCQCTCEVAKSVLASSTSALGNPKWTDSPYRGVGCEITCPGYDGYDLASICNSRGVCQRDGKCTCSQGYTGDACQFECPVNDRNETCSLHGGCGTQAIDESSYRFQGDNYLDTLTAKNRRHYQFALRQYYDSCNEENFIEEKGTFGSHVSSSGVYTSSVVAKNVCNEINRLLDVDQSQLKNRLYPTGLCVGVSNNSPMILDPITALVIPIATDAFSCERADCNIALSETDSRVVSGVSVQLTGDQFQINMQYVHGSSTGLKIYLVNGYPIQFEIVWTPQKCHITMEAKDFKYILVDTDEAIQYVLLKVVGTDVSTEIYPTLLPSSSDQNTIYLAPMYDKKYIQMTTDISGYWFNAMSQDTGQERKLMTRADAESECDIFTECDGIIRWPTLYKNHLYSMFTSFSSVENVALAALNHSVVSFDYFAKSSQMYRGRILAESKCERVKPGQSKYPTVSYSEEYNIPIESVDLDSVRDEETNSVQIGKGVWTNCWTHMPSINTKIGCYEEAKKAHYGFAFSDVSSTCLIYTGIDDPSRIKLNEYNDENRLTRDHPCSMDSMWFT